MTKRGNCINIFVDNKRNLNLYQVSSIAILLIICFQVSLNLIKYTQLNNYILSYNNTKLINENVDKLYLEEKVSNPNSEIKNTSIKECTINLSEIKDLSYIIDIKNIESIYIDSNQVKMQGFCENIKVLEDLSGKDNIRNFNINSLERKGAYYFFDIEYKLGGTVETNKK